MHDIEPDRYIYDPLYGIVYLPQYMWTVLSCPELQRLREVRLCNINSLCLTGGANINRFEHSIGTCHLALECLANWPPLNPLDERTKRQFILAALLHDIANGPFGHSIEYIESKKGFDPEEAFKYVVLGTPGQSYNYWQARLEPIFFSLQKDLVRRLPMEDIEAIGKIIGGKGRLGQLINGNMDLDNIDNVFRLAYHIGIVKSGEVALNLARSLFVERGKVVVKEKGASQIQEWFNVRRKLYSFLLLNPEEFSAKCMLSEAVELAKLKPGFALTWHDTDYDLLVRLLNASPIRLEERGYLFAIDTSFENELNCGVLSEKLKSVLEQKRLRLSSNAQLELMSGGWKIIDKVKDKTKCYIIEKNQQKLDVYMKVLRGFDVRGIIKSLVKGDLYGCVGIFSTTKTEKGTIFDDPHTRRELENGASEIVGRTFQGRFRSVSIAFHLIKDINKTERQIAIEMDNGQIATIGTSSKRHLIGAFFRNPQLNLYHVNDKPRIVGKIRKEILTYLSTCLEDPAIEEVRLYGEAK
jgi:hypothetical protein